MATKQRISDLEKYTVTSLAAFVDAGHVLVGLAEEIPVVGFGFVAVNFLVSLFSFLGFSAWYIKVGIGSKRIWYRIALNLTVLFMQLFMSGVPYGGPIIDAILMLFFTINTYLLIVAVQKEDKEAAAKQLDQIKAVSVKQVKQITRV